MIIGSLTTVAGTPPADGDHDCADADNGGCPLEQEPWERTTQDHVPDDIRGRDHQEQQVNREAERGEQAGGNDQALGAAQPRGP
jgi:hypothetical protein